MSFLAAWLLAASAWAQTGAKPELVVQMGHTGGVHALAVSPDGKYLATGSNDRTAVLWDLASGTELRVFKSHGDPSRAAFPKVSVAFSPDGKLLATGLGDTAETWEVATGRLLKAYHPERSWIDFVSFTPDGKALLGGGLTNAYVWDLGTGQLLQTIIDGSESTECAAISPDGKYLATGRYGHNDAGLEDLSTGNEVKTLSHLAGVYAVAFSPDGRSLATGSGESVRLWDVSTGEKTKVFAGKSGDVLSLAFSRDGKFLAAGMRGAAEVWDLDSGASIRILPTGIPDPVHVGFSADGKDLLTGSDGQSQAVLWSISSGERLRTFRGHASLTTAVALSSDETFMATSSSESAADVWDLSAGGKMKTLAFEEIIPHSVDELAFSPDGKLLAMGSISSGAHLWDIAASSPTRTLYSQADVVSIAFSPDGRSFATGSQDDTAKLWDVSTGKELWTVKAEGFVQSVLFSPDGRTLVTGGSDANPQLWDVEGGRPIRTLNGSKAWAMAMTPDGKFLATGDWSVTGSVTLWDLGVGSQVRTFDGKQQIYSVAFSPDGDYLAGGGQDGAVRLWDIASGEAKRTFIGHTDWVKTVLFAPDQKHLLSGSTDGTLRIWDRSSGRELGRLVNMEGGDWVVVTPEGLFDGSPGGMRTMRWTVGLASYALEAFSEGYYVPGLLGKLLRGEPAAPAKLPSLAQGFALPPLAKIVSPKNGAVLVSDSVDVMVTATDQGGGIDEIRLYQNGKALEGETRDVKVVGKGGRAAGKRTQTFHVTLLDGLNRFRAVALSKERIEGPSDEIGVTLKGAEKQASLHVLVVGINRYKNADLDLNYAQPDAAAIEGFFTSASSSLFKVTTHKELFDGAATKAGILAALRELKATAPQDVVVIYLAGHGESLGDAWYFVPYDLVYPEQEPQVKSLGLSSKELRNAMRGMGAQKVLLMLDACKSGGAMLAFAGRGVEDRKALSMLARAAGVHVVAASTKDQLASEVEQLGHGVFTYTLLEGLNGKAASNGLVTVGSLLTYLQSELPEVSRKYRAQSQYPVVDSRGMDFPIATAK